MCLQIHFWIMRVAKLQHILILMHFIFIYFGYQKYALLLSIIKFCAFSSWTAVYFVFWMTGCVTYWDFEKFLNLINISDQNSIKGKISLTFQIWSFIQNALNIYQKSSADITYTSFHSFHFMIKLIKLFQYLSLIFSWN